MRAAYKCLAALFLVQVQAQTAEAASLRVSPVTLDMRLPRTSATLMLKNDADRALDVQIRVFRWTQEGGVDRYEPTTAVVASPPATRLSSNVDYMVRVVRISKAPIATEESYRVIIDELPTNIVRRSGTINLVMRHSIPVFFRNPQAVLPKVNWKLTQAEGRSKLVAENLGGTRLKLANLSILQGNAPFFRQKGLVGYVLAGSTMEWPIVTRKRASGSVVHLKGDSQLGAVDENVPVVRR